MTIIDKMRLVYNNETFCKFLLVLTAIVWGSSYFLIKDIIQIIDVGWLLAIRFLMSSAFLFLIAYKKILAHLDYDTIILGVILGAFGFGGYLAQNVGLIFTTPGKNAFLTGTFAVIVPFVAWAAGMGRPERNNVVGAILAVLGLGFVALDSSSTGFNIGDALTLVCACFYAMQTVEVAKRGSGINIVCVTFWEMLVMGLLYLGYALVVDDLPQLSKLTPNNYLVLFYLSIICSFLVLMFCNHAYTKVNPSAGAVLSSLESPFGVAFSVAFGYEVLTARLLCGFALILIGVIFSEAGPSIVQYFQKTSLKSKG